MIKRIGAMVMISIMLISTTVSTTKSSAMGVALPIMQDLVEMLRGMAPMLGFLIDPVAVAAMSSQAVSEADAMFQIQAGTLKTSAVQALSQYTSANDDGAFDGVIMLNFLKEYATKMSKSTTGGLAYVQWYFTNSTMMQRFKQAVLSFMSNVLSPTQLATHQYSGTSSSIPANTYQKWSNNVPDSPSYTNVYPYQIIANCTAGLSLIMSNSPLYQDLSGIIHGSVNYSWMILRGSTWYFYSGQTVNNWGISIQSISQANNNVYDYPAQTTLKFEKTTTIVQDGRASLNPYFKAPTTAVELQSTAVWAGNSISVPAPSVASDVLTGAKPIADIAATYTAEGTIPMTDTVAQSVTATVANTATAEWSKENWSVPEIIFTKFPFCLPWDLKNAISLLVASPIPPKWTFSFPSNIFIGGGEITVDLAQFEPWAKVSRWAMMIIFNLGLIYATRRLIGA